MSDSAVFLDRDGVINSYVYDAEFGTVDSPSNPDAFALLPSAGKAIAELNRLGLKVLVVSNQPGIAKGKFSAVLLDRITEKMHAEIAKCGGHLDGVYYCLHHPDSVLPEYRLRCDCRKPHPGMLLKAAKEMDLDLGRAFMIGDGISDIEAGVAAGTRTIFVGQSKPYILDAFEQHGISPDFIASSLFDAVIHIQQQMESAAISEVEERHLQV